MAKKSRKPTHKRGIALGLSHADKLHDTMQQQMLQGNYEEAIKNGELLLSLLPQRSLQRSVILEQLGAMYGVQKDYARCYHAYTEPLNIEPDNAGLWYNRGLASRRTSHIGQSVRDFERAVELNTDAELAKMIERELKQSRKMAQKELKKRRRDFTLDQLIEQENLHLATHEHMEAGRWAEAEQSLRAIIVLEDYVPQFWANLGTCLIMQERYDEAEAAFKHALKLDPWYTLARHNLRNLPEVRRNGPPKMLGISESSRRVNITKFVEYE